MPETAPPKMSANDLSNKIVAGVEQVVKTHVPQSPRVKSSWRSSETWAVYALLALTGLAVAKPRDINAGTQEALAVGSSMAVAGHGWNRRKLKTSDPTSPAAASTFAILNYAGGKK